MTTLMQSKNEMAAIVSPPYLFLIVPQVLIATGMADSECPDVSAIALSKDVQHIRTNASS